MPTRTPRYSSRPGQHPLAELPTPALTSRIRIIWYSQLTTTRPPTIEDDQINVEIKPKAEKPKAIEERKKIFENLYTYHRYAVAHIKPTQWMCLAGAEEILDLEFFRELHSGSDRGCYAPR